MSEHDTLTVAEVVFLQSPKLNGVTLEWWGMSMPFNTFMFRAVHPSYGYGRIQFSHVLDVSIVPVMHNVHIRLAKPSENEALLNQLTEAQMQFVDAPRDMNFSPDDCRVIIDCDEGTFSVWAHKLEITWWNDSNINLDREVDHQGEPVWNFDGSLWKGGPPLAEL